MWGEPPSAVQSSAARQLCLGGTLENSPPLQWRARAKIGVRAVGTAEMPERNIRASLTGRGCNLCATRARQRKLKKHDGAKRPASVVRLNLRHPLASDVQTSYSATASFSITTFKCAVTSLCSFTGTVNSPRVFSGSWSWICRRSRLIPFFAMASARSPEVTEPNN
jgi:hypothetical protein